MWHAIEHEKIYIVICFMPMYGFVQAEVETGFTGAVFNAHLSVAAAQMMIKVIMN